MTAMDIPPAALILQSPFTSLRDMGIEVAGSIAHVTLNRWRTRQTLPRIHAPVLILHADKDEVVPLQHGKLNAESRVGCNFVTSFHIQRGCTHNEFNFVADVCEPGAAFIRKHVKFVGEACCIDLNESTIPVYSIVP